MNCIYKKVRTKKGKKYGYCTLLKKEVNLFNCKCSSITYKKINPIKSRTNKQAQKEKERFSIIYTDLTKCCECGLKAGDFDTRLNLYTRIEKNEIFSRRCDMRRGDFWHIRAILAQQLRFAATTETAYGGKHRKQSLC